MRRQRGQLPEIRLSLKLAGSKGSRWEGLGKNKEFPGLFSCVPNLQTPAVHQLRTRLVLKSQDGPSSK